MFQANTNASLKNLETQVGQLALTMQNQSKDAFPSDTRNNPKDCMVVTLRSGRGIESINEEEKKKTKIVEAEESGTEKKLSSSVEIEGTGKDEVQTEQQVAYMPACLLFPFLGGFKGLKWKSSSLNSWISSRR